jgi:hypothetical protein
MTSPGGAGNPARDGTHEPSRAAGHIPCTICTHPISLDEYHTARCWTDPQANTVAAHAACLIRIGEHELSLPPDPREHSTAHGVAP